MDSTFAKQEDLPLFEGMLNPSVEPENEFRLSGQNLEVFKKLLKGPATNTELQKLTGSMNQSARISDVRKEVEERLDWTLEKIRSGKNGVNTYALIDAEGKIVD